MGTSSANADAAARMVGWLTLPTVSSEAKTILSYTINTFIDLWRPLGIASRYKSCVSHSVTLAPTRNSTHTDPYITLMVHERIESAFILHFSTDKIFSFCFNATVDSQHYLRCHRIVSNPIDLNGNWRIKRRDWVTESKTGWVALEETIERGTNEIDSMGMGNSIVWICGCLPYWVFKLLSNALCAYVFVHIGFSCSELLIISHQHSLLFSPNRSIVFVVVYSVISISNGFAKHLEPRVWLMSACSTFNDFFSTRFFIEFLIDSVFDFVSIFFFADKW